MTATGTDTKSNEVKSVTLLYLAGPNALEIYNTFTWTTEGDNKKIEKIWKNLKSTAHLGRISPWKGTYLIPECIELAKLSTSMSLTCERKLILASLGRFTTASFGTDLSVA